MITRCERHPLIADPTCAVCNTLAAKAWPVRLIAVGRTVPARGETQAHMRGPTTKKTSNRVVGIGAQCRACGGRERTIVLPSEAFVEWEEIAAPQLRASWGEIERAIVACSRCEGVGRVQFGKTSERCMVGCDGTGKRPRPLDVPIAVRAIVYRQREAGDLAGYIQAIGDILETAGVVENDERIKSWDGTRLAKDAHYPRIELELTLFQ